MANSFPQFPSGTVTVQPTSPADYANMSKNDLAIISAKADRKKFIAALDEGTLACLPGKDGMADTQAARNVVNRTTYHGSAQLLLKDFQKRNGFPTADFCTHDQMEKAAKFAGANTLYLKRGTRGITLNFQIAGEQKSVRLFNVAQIQNPKPVYAYAEHLAQTRENTLREKYGDRYRPARNNAGGPPVMCTTSEPSGYLGQYLAALSLGRPFKATQEQAAEFTQRAKDFIFEHNTQGHINPFNLNRLGSKASLYCKEFIPEIVRPSQGPEQRQRPAQRVAEPSTGR
ncbi:MAG: ssDNA-binding domain-containing protein [Treponema sp.]|jgi:hypothetical protein|nr:ssDNA-binding domain-containing protein [Treponema sp.]